MTRLRKITFLVLTATLLGFAGCAADIGKIGGQEQDLTAILPIIGIEASVGAGACQGQITGFETFAMIGEDGLIAAVDGGQIVCVDTVGAVRKELEDVGRPDKGRALVASYRAAFGTGVLALGDPNPQPSQPGGSTAVTGFGSAVATPGDPNPQPSIDPSRHPWVDSNDQRNAVDPQPQPSIDPVGGDPNPQPSSPGERQPR